MRFWRKSLQTRLVLSFLLVSLITVALVGAVSNRLAQRALEQSIFARLEAVAVVKEATLNRWQEDRRADVVLMARLPEIREAGSYLVNPEAALLDDEYMSQAQAYEALDQALSDILTRRFDLNEIFIVAPDGRIVYSTNQAHEGQLVSEPYFSEGLNKTYLQNIYHDAEGKQTLMTISTPLRTIEGQAQGVLAAHLNLEGMERIVLEQTGLGEAGETYLVDDDGRQVRVIDPFGQLTYPGETEPIQSAGITAALAGENGRARYQNYEATAVLGVYHWLDDLQLALLAEMPEAEAFAPARELSYAITATGLVGAALLGIIIYLFARSISQPIVDLTHTATRITEGDLRATAVVQTEDEIGILAQTFNEMTEQLRRLYLSLEAQVNSRTAELAERVQQLNLINQVGRSAISHLELDELLAEAVKLIRQSFGFYAVGILLVDRTRQEVYLSAEDTIEDTAVDFSGFSLKIESPSIITQVIKTGKPLVANDVSQNQFYLADDRLPRVQSELGLPLKVGDDVIGVLEIQHSEKHAFSPEDVQVLQTLSDQLAVAIHNAELFEAAESARADAEEANWMKSQFLANMSHELRTPLNAIINFAYLMSLGLDGPLTAEQTDMLNRVGDSGRHLLGLINNILDLAKIEAGRIDLFLEKVYLPELIHGVMATAVGLTRGKPIELHTEIPDDLPLVQADSNRIRQVLLNLVANAVKFTDAGHITIRAVADDSQWVTVSVADTGIGMRPEDISKAFTEFVQLDGDLSRRVGGTGLGLSITRKFIEMHGGEIWVESELGQGATFYFSLPQYETGPTPPTAQHITKEVAAVYS
jgi:signal transduction histidine kinase/HAMP domain-containing protein